MIRLVLCASAVMLFSAGRAHAQSAFDGSVDLICSPSEVSVCDNAARCRHGQVRDFSVPRFVTIRFSTGEIEQKYAGDRSRVGGLGQVVDTGRHIVIQTVIDGAADTIVINKKSGDFQATGIEPQVNFFLAGFCKRY